MALVEAKFVVPPLDDICRRFHISRLRLFGSAVRGELKPESDIDLIVDFETGHKLSGLEWLDLFDVLSGSFDGRHMDVMTVDQVHGFIRRSVIASAQTIYER